MNEKVLKAQELAKKSIIEKVIQKESALKEKELAAYKKKSLTYAACSTLVVWLGVGIVIANILIALAIAIGCGAVLFLLFLYLPVRKQQAYAKKIEAELPDFLVSVTYELKAGKSFLMALTSASQEKNSAAREFAQVLDEIHKGAGVALALDRMNKRVDSLSLLRANSNLYTIWLHGAESAEGLKRLTKELFLKQRIESKEFSSKMVVYALVFIAISAIVPAMFQSFILIGSYFMKITMSPLTILLIITVGFPCVNIAVLMLINSKTPIFLKQQ